jgi:FkbM family methyltransferase
MTNKLEGLRVILTFENWPSVLLARIFDRKTGFVVYRKKGLDILIDHHGDDENGTRTCIATDMYRKYLPFFMLPGSARVLDLGANGGGFPLMLKIEGIDIDRVVSVEMNPITFTRLQLNLATNLGQSAVALNNAVCGIAEESEILLKPNRGGTNNSMFADRVDESTPHVAVRTITLQALYDQYFKDEIVDICKIDIESAEYELIEGSPDDLLRKMRYIIIELHDPPRTPALLEKLTRLGFTEIAVPGHQPEEHGDVRALRGPTATFPTA